MVLMENKIIVVRSVDDLGVNARSLHKLQLQPDLSFTGIQIKKSFQNYIIESPNGAARAGKGDWAVIFPDGNLYKVSKTLFKYMFNTEMGVEGIGNPCIFKGCTGIYGKVQGEVRCSKCNDLYPPSVRGYPRKLM